MGDLDTGQAEAVRHALKDPAERAYRRNEELAAYPGSRVHPVLPTATYRPSRANKDSAVNNDHSTEQVLFKRSKTRQPSKRQQVGAGVGNVNDGYPACNNVDNDVLACFPEDDTVLEQGDYSKFIWNTNYPVYIGAGYVDIHLFNAGSEEELFAWRNISTFRGSVGYQVDDAWLPTQTTWTEGQTLTHSYYFVIATRGADVERGARHQATFEVLQTSPPATLASQLAAAGAFASSASVAAADAAASSPSPTAFPDGVIPPALASSIVLSGTDLGSIPLTFTGDLSTITDLAGLTLAAASVSSARSSLDSVISSLSAAGSPIPSSLLSSLSGLSTLNEGIASTESSVVSSIARTRGPSILRGNDGNGDPVPKWAIALIAVFGFFALLAGLVALWFILRRMRRKRRESRYEEAKGGVSAGDGSVATSATPTRGVSALGAAAAVGEKEPRPLSESFSDGTGNTGRMSSASGGALGTGTSPNSNQLPARGGSAASAAALAARASNKRSDSPALRSLERSNTDSPHHFYDASPPSARFAGAAATGGSGSSGRGGVINKASSRSLGTNASTGAGTIAPYDAAIMADAYRNVLRKPEFPRRGDDFPNSGENSTPGQEGEGDTPPILGAVKSNTRQDAEGEEEEDKMPHTPKASGTTTPMAFGDSGSEGEHSGILSKAVPMERGNSASSGISGNAGNTRYGGRESDEEDGTEANELIRHELASEGTSVKSNVERKRPDIRHD